MSAQLRIEIAETQSGGGRSPASPGGGAQQPGPATPGSNAPKAPGGPEANKSKPGETPDKLKSVLGLAKEVGLDQVSGLISRVTRIFDATLNAVKGFRVPATAAVGGAAAASGAVAAVGPSVAGGAAAAAGGAAAGGAAAGAGGAAAGGAAATGVMAGLAAALGPVGITVAALAAAAVATTIAFKLLSSAVKSQAESLAQYSPELSIAQAIGEIRDMQSEMRRAEEVGPGLARMYDQISRFENAFYDIGTSLLKVVVKIFEKLEPFIEFINDTMELIAASIDFMVDSLSVIANAMTGHLPSAMEGIKEMNESLERIGKALKGFFEKNQDLDNFNDPFLGELHNLFIGMGGKGHDIFKPAKLGA